jgi:hypothetical protein
MRPSDNAIPNITDSEVFSTTLRRSEFWWPRLRLICGLGQWVGGAGSIAAAGVAVSIADGGWRRSETRANARDQQVEQLRRRELASAFGVWVEPDETGLTAEIKSVNGGPLPMYNVELMLMFRVRETGRDWVIVLDIECDVCFRPWSAFGGGGLAGECDFW